MEVGTSATIQIYRAAATAPANPAERGEGLEDIVVERAHELEGSDEEVRGRAREGGAGKKGRPGSPGCYGKSEARIVKVNLLTLSASSSRRIRG